MALLYTGQQWSVILGILALGIALKAALVLWLHRDVRAAGEDGWRWTIAGIFAFIPTAVVWRIKRPQPQVSTPRPRTVVSEEEEPYPADADPFRVGLRGPVSPEGPEPGAVRAALAGPTVGATPSATSRVSCPRCAHRFAPERTEAGRVTCPSCGATGRL